MIRCQAGAGQGERTEQKKEDRIRVKKISTMIRDFLKELEEQGKTSKQPHTDFSNNINEFTINDGFRIIHSYPPYTRPGMKRELVVVVDPDVKEDRDTILYCPEKYTTSIHTYLTSSEGFKNDEESAKKAADVEKENHEILKKLYATAVKRYETARQAGEAALDNLEIAVDDPTETVLDGIEIAIEDSNFNSGDGTKGPADTSSLPQYPPLDESVEMYLAGRTRTDRKDD